MKVKVRKLLAVGAIFGVGAVAAAARAQQAAHSAEQQISVDRSQYVEAERAVYLARAAEQRGDVMSAAEKYSRAISLVESTAPRQVNLSKLMLAGESLPSIGRRMLYYELKLLQEQLAEAHPMMSPDAVLKLISGNYAKMGAIEKNNPTWPYLEAVAYAANHDYRMAFQKCREAAQAPGGEESVRQKARSLAAHVKSAALEQEKMREEDQRAYEEYVQSGAQALDFAMVSAQVSANQARQGGDSARADMWERRYEDLRKERDQINVR